jgi:hypothetical protein
MLNARKQMAPAGFTEVTMLAWRGLKGNHIFFSEEFKPI